MDPEPSSTPPSTYADPARLPVRRRVPSCTNAVPVNVFAAVGEYELRPDPDELAGGRFWTPEEIEQAIGKGVLTPNFEGEYQRVKDALLALL